MNSLIFNYFILIYINLITLFFSVQFHSLNLIRSDLIMFILFYYLINNKNNISMRTDVLIIRTLNHLISFACKKAANFWFTQQTFFPGAPTDSTLVMKQEQQGVCTQQFTLNIRAGPTWSGMDYTPSIYKRSVTY